MDDDEILRLCEAHASTGCNLYPDIPRILAELKALMDENLELKLRLEKYESGSRDTE
jgi:hypothetical protein